MSFQSDGHPSALSAFHAVLVLLLAAGGEHTVCGELRLTISTHEMS